MAAAGDGHTIQVWDLTDLSAVPPARILRGHRHSVMSLALTPDATTLVSGARDGSVLGWNISSNTSAIRRSSPAILPSNLPEYFHPWRFASDNTSVLAVDLRGRAARWHGADFQEMQSLLEFRTNIRSACISDDGHWAAASLSNGIVQVGDLRRGAVTREFQAHSGRIMPLQFLTEGKKLVLFHEDDLTFHEWDLINGRETRFWQGGSPNLTDFTAAFSPDQRSCLTLAIKGGGSLLTDLATLRTSDPHLDLSIPFCAAYSPDGKLFAAGREVTAPLGGFLSSVSSVAFSQDVKRLATGSILKEAVKLWDVESSQELLTLGLKVNEELVRKQIEIHIDWWTPEIDRAYEMMIGGATIAGPSNLGYGLMGLAAVGHPADEVTQAMVWHVDSFRVR